MKTKFFLFVLAIVASIGSLSADSGKCGDNVTWNLTDGVLTISGTGDMNNYHYEGYYSPWADASIKIVIIYNGVTSIGDNAFYGCSSLTSVTIPNSVTSIGSGAFKGCNNLPVENNLRYADTYLVGVVNKDITSVSIKEGTRFIGDYAFYDCSGLTSVTIPNNVTSIGDYAFSGCSGLTSVTIPNSVTSIGDYAFYDCSGLTYVTIGSSVTSIGYNAFHGCSSLTSVTIPNSVTSIGSGAFEGCNNLPVENNLRYADTYLVGVVNKDITSVSIKEGTRFIGDYAFYDCSGLTSVTIPNSVTSIGDYAFYDCSGLTSVTIPNSVTSIGGYAFYGCNNLPVENNLRYADTYLVGVVNKDITSVSIKEGTRFIGSSALSGCSGLTSVTIPNSVTSIGYSAFRDCSGLTSVTIPNSVTSIGSSAFEGCSGLTSVTIPNSVTNIGYNAFSSCSGLTSITIPESVTSIGEDAFYYCSGLNEVHIEDLAVWCKISFGSSDANPLYYAHNLYLNGSLITDLVIPNSVTSIGGCAFYGCSGLTSVTIPNSVTSIGDYAFRDCSSLTSVTIGNSVTSIGSGAFYGCSGLKSVTIPNSVTSIGYYAFSGCSSLTSIEIPNSVTSIGSSAFQGCSSLTSVTIPNSVTSIGSSAFSGCSGLASVTIPNSVTSIGDYAFSGCSGLTSITIPESVTSIGSEAFKGCSSLTSIYVPCGEIERFKQMINDNNFSNLIRDDSPLPYTITITPTDKGKVNYPKNKCDDMLLTAVPDYGYYFVQWSDGIKNNPRTIELTQDTTFAAEFAVSKSGTCGTDEQLTWKYDSESKTLTITGNGKLDDNMHYGVEAPEAMTTLIVEDGVESIGPEAFSQMATLTSVTLSKDIKKINEKAFYNCENLTTIYNYRETPTTVYSNTFDGVDKYACTLYVLANSVEMYKNSDWRSFYNILPISASSEATDDVQITPTNNTAGVLWPSILGAFTYELIIRDKWGNTICSLVFNKNGLLLSIIFRAPSAANNAPQQQMQEEGFSFTVTGLESGSQYELTINSKDEDEQIIETVTKVFTTTGGSNVATDVEAVGNEPSAAVVQKILRNGHFYILMPDGEIYDMSGKRME